MNKISSLNLEGDDLLFPQEPSFDADEASSFDQNYLYELNSLFQNLIEESKCEPVLQRHEAGICKIYTALQTVLRNESLLFNRGAQLKTERNELSAKYEHALELSEVDQKTRTDLLEELDNAWNQASRAKSKELHTLETLNSLKLEIYNLSKLVEQVGGLTMGQEYNIREVSKQKEKLIVETKMLSLQIDEFMAKNVEAEARQSELSAQLDALNLKQSHANQELILSQFQNQKLTRKIEQLEEELLNKTALNESHEAGNTRLADSLKLARSQCLKHEQTIKDLNSSLDKAKKELGIHHARFQKLQNETDQQYIKNDSLMIENSQLVQQLRRKEEQLDAIRAEQMQAQRMRELYEKKTKQHDEEKLNMSVEQRDLEAELNATKRDVETLTKSLDTQLKQLELMRHEKELVSSQISKLNKRLEKKDEQLKALKASLDESIAAKAIIEKDMNDHKKTALSCELQRNNLIANTNQYSVRLAKACGQIKLKELGCIDMKKKCAQYEMRLGQMQRLYEAVRLDRNLYSKNLNESEKERQLLKKNVASLQLELADLKGNFGKCDAQLTNLAAEKAKCESFNINLKAKFDALSLETKQLEQRLDGLLINEKKHLKTILDQENAVISLRKTMGNLIMERNVFGSQLVRRNDEISLLYEKIRIQTGVLQRGTLTFQLVQQELNKCRRQLATAKQQNQYNRNNLKLVKQLKSRLLYNEKEFLIEKSKRNALEAGEHTYNLHRWHRMHVTDPGSYELVLKVNFLQKKLISKTEQVARLNLNLLEKEQLFVQLKQQFIRRFTFEEDLNSVNDYKRMLASSENKLKVKLFHFSCLYVKMS